MPIDPRTRTRFAAKVIALASLLILPVLWLAPASGPARITAWRLADGTEVFFRSGTRVTVPPDFPHPRSLQLDGEVFVRAPDIAIPLTIHSRLLTLTLSDGAAVRITAFASETGEQAEVVRGRVVARKAYPSRDSAPDTLVAGEMIMVNQTIDLMEKERDTPEVTQRWADELIRAAGLPQAKQ